MLLCDVGSCFLAFFLDRILYAFYDEPSLIVEDFSA